MGKKTEVYLGERLYYSMVWWFYVVFGPFLELYLVHCEEEMKKIG